LSKWALFSAVALQPTAQLYHAPDVVSHVLPDGARFFCDKDVDWALNPQGVFWMGAIRAEADEFAEKLKEAVKIKLPKNLSAESNASSRKKASNTREVGAQKTARLPFAITRV
jgi:hypothetical protein